MIKKRIRHTQRFQEIVNMFIKNGFSHFFFRIGLTDRQLKKNKDVNMNLKDIGIKLHQTLQQLGPTFIKLGQIASSRRDLIPDEITLELEKLQDDVMPVSFERIKQIIETELEQSIENLFDRFNEEPLATASIGQVHVAHLFTGEEVAIKIQRPDIQQTMEIDLEILLEITQFLEERFLWARSYRIHEMIDELSLALREELDYIKEGRNAVRIAKQFRNDPTIYIPEIYWKFTTKKVLTMEMIRGIKVNQLEQLDKKGYDRKIIAKRITDSMLHQVLEHGFFHGDPHPGNIFILPDNVISYLDFGMVGRLSEEMTYHFASIVINLQQGNNRAMIETFFEMGLIDDDTNLKAFRRDLDHLQTKYYDISLKNISLGSVITEILGIAYEHQMKVPTDITILAKAIITLEEIIKKLDPTLSIMKAIEPLGEKLIKKRYRPKNIVKHSLSELMENIDVLSNIPKSILDLTTTMKKGKLRVEMNVTDLQALLKRLDRISNRLSFSIILLSFSILMVGLIIGAAIVGQTTLLWNVPVIEIGSVVATVMFLFMIYTIIRSGRM